MRPVSETEYELAQILRRIGIPPAESSLLRRVECSLARAPFIFEDVEAPGRRRKVRLWTRVEAFEIEETTS